ncbi:MAG: gliding motility lipoprotein GldH [Draconibacterium sp.]
MKKIFQLTWTVLCLCMLAACQPKIIYEKYKEIDQRSWDKDSLAIFEVPVSDTTHNFDLYLNIRNDVDYKYSNLWLFIKIEEPNGKSIDDKFEITLADPTGKWLGEGMGGLKTREILYRRNIFFPDSGNFKITLQQGMREDVLKGISDVGVRIEKANN